MMNATQNPIRGGCPQKLGLIRGGLLSACLVAAPVSAAELKLGGLTFWTATVEDTESTAAPVPSLLRPAANGGWDMAAPTVDFATDIEQRFTTGLRLDSGVSAMRAAEMNGGGAINYRDYFLGMRYGSLDTKVWYLPASPTNTQAAVYYEAGWLHPVGKEVSLSLHLGQYDQSGYANAGYDTVPSLSLGASTTVGGYGLGLRLIDGGRLFGGEQDVRLMGSISKPFE